MDSHPLVSIITPAFNRADYLPETIDSVLMQKYPNLEYIVLDDGSTDNTRDLLAQYAGRLIWESHPNMGETRTVNQGFAMAHGEIICIVNSDDPLLPGAICKTVEFMQGNPDILVAYPDWNYIGPDSRLLKHRQVPEYDYLVMLGQHDCIVGPGAFIRRKAIDLIGGRDPEFRNVADYEFWIRLGRYGKFARIPQTLATFRVHPTSASMSQRGTEFAEEHIRLMDKYYATPDLPDEVKAIKNEAYRNAYIAASDALGEGNIKTRRKYYLAELRLTPLKNLFKYRMRLKAMAPAFLGYFYMPVRIMYVLLFHPKRLWEKATKHLRLEL